MNKKPLQHAPTQSQAPQQQIDESSRPEQGAEEKKPSAFDRWYSTGLTWGWSVTIPLGIAAQTGNLASIGSGLFFAGLGAGSKGLITLFGKCCTPKQCMKWLAEHPTHLANKGLNALQIAAVTAVVAELAWQMDVMGEGHYLRSPVDTYNNGNYFVAEKVVEALAAYTISEAIPVAVKGVARLMTLGFKNSNNNNYQQLEMGTNKQEEVELEENNNSNDLR